uniref:Ycf15 n=1 Tax=Heterorhabditis bacteriophora TaxID=37862 RepID=A0A1I7X020_HETBA
MFILITYYPNIDGRILLGVFFQVNK